MNYKHWIQGFLAICLFAPGWGSMAAFAAPVKPMAGQVVAQNSQQLTEESIRQVLKAMKVATDQEDVEAMLEFIAPFAHSEIIVELPNNTTLTTSIDGTGEHRALLEQSFALIKNRKTNEKADIRLSADGQMGTAIITGEQEFITEDGKEFLSRSVDTLRFGLVDNQPVVVSATLKGWLAEISSSQR